MKINKSIKSTEERGLRWFHWLVFASSILLTLTVWQYTKNQNQEKVKNAFQLESEKVVEHILERLQTYEDGLSGVSLRFTL